MRTISIFLILSILIFACKSAKSIQKIEEPVSKADTTPPVIIPKNKSENQKQQVETSGKDIFERIIKNNIDFNSFSGRVRVHYEGTESADDATAFIRLQKDSVIWLSLRGTLGVEGFRVLITRDSVKVMDLLKKNIQHRTINYLGETTGIPFDFSTLQDFIVGNAVFIDSNVVSYKANENNTLLVSMSGTLFKNLLSVNIPDFRILSSKLESTSPDKNLTCEIDFSDYQNAAGSMFSTKRKILVTGKSKLSIALDFKQYSFNQSLTFPFNIPKNYKSL